MTHRFDTVPATPPDAGFPFRHGATSVLALVLLTPLVAAAPQSASQPPDPSWFRVPIHTQPRDQLLGDYGLWASGDTYKVSFHDGFAFYPVLGPQAPENLPLRWTTVRVSVGGQAIAVPETLPVPNVSPWRCEYRLGPVVEAYDVLPHGVEQTFVIARRPDVAGDLAIDGAVATRLVAPAVGPAVQDLVFADAGGTARVRYGKATAVDARGQRGPVTTQWDGAHVRLVVPAAWLATATFPVVVDPLTSSLTFLAGIGTNPEGIAMHNHDETLGYDTMVAYVRSGAAGDHDLFVRASTSDLQSTAPIFTDISAGWSSLAPDVTYVGGADRWVVAFWRQTPTEDRLRVYFHDRDSRIEGSGILDSSYNPIGEHASYPSLGGSVGPVSGTRALLVYRMDPVALNSDVSQIHAVTVDAATRTLGGRLIVEAGSDAENPEVNCQRGVADDGWVLVYPVRSSTRDDYDIVARRILVDPILLISPPVVVGPDGLGDKGSAVVQGQDGRYAVAMVQDGVVSANGMMSGRSILGARLDWANLGATPVVRPHKVLVTSPLMDLRGPALAFDSVTRSHWCLVHDSDTFGSSPTVRFRRLGLTLGTVESGIVGAPRFGAAVAWNEAAREFQIISGSVNGVGVLHGQRLVYPPLATNRWYGAACGPALIESDTLPLAGSETYRVLLNGAPAGQAAVLCYSTGAGSLSLAGIGAPGCTLNLASIDAMFPVPIDATGVAVATFGLPDDPALFGDLFWQYLYVWPGAPTPLPLGATIGLRTAVR